MNRLASILPVAQVLVGVEATSKKRAFEEAGLLFENLHGLSRALVTDSLFARERLGSTGLGHGVETVSYTHLTLPTNREV